jgi:hypothetical protein
LKTIIIPASDCYDEESERFITVKEQKLVIEHSLVSISKWESKWKKPFISTAEKTMEELQDYVRCMTLTQNVNDDVYKAIPVDIMNEIIEYMNDPMSATWFSDIDKKHNGRNGEVITSELIYYWMTAANIPIECQKWHLNRLMTLIRIAGEKNQPPKKMSKNDILRQNKSLNAMRRARAKSRG